MGQMGLFGKVDPPEARDLASDFLSIPKDAPLAHRMTPRSFDEFVGQEDVVGPGRALRSSIEGDNIPSMLFWGPPGTGKTGLARLIAWTTRSAFRELSAVAAGVADVRRVVSDATALRRRGTKTILFLDEIHRFNKAQQDALLPHVEKGIVILIGATTENPYVSVNQALLSRMRIFTFTHLEPRHITAILHRAISDKERGLGEGPVVVPDEVLAHIVAFAKGDARTALNLLETLHNIGEKRDGKTVLSLEKAMEVTQSPQLFYDRTGDSHYDIASSFIKSMRGSDPDATIYWLARMLTGGEDPKFVARRIVIAAAEDVGLADPMALVVAESAFRAVEHVGMPEARIPLAQAALYIALAPKSNSVCVSVDAAMEVARNEPPYRVPPHLRGTGYEGASNLGHGLDYKYAHAYPGHWVPQQYLPDELASRTFYDRKEHDPPNRGKGER